MKKYTVYIVVVLIVALIAAMVYGLTNGFKSGLKSFALIRSDGNYILNDKNGVTLVSGDTLKIQHYGVDKKINTKIQVQSLAEDWTFDVDGFEYSWNNDVVGQVEDFTEYFDLKIDQDVNTISVNSSVTQALSNYFGGVPIGIRSTVPKDMFRMEIETDGVTIVLGVQFLARVTGIKLSNDHLNLIGYGVTR